MYINLRSFFIELKYTRRYLSALFSQYDLYILIKNYPMIAFVVSLIASIVLLNAERNTHRLKVFLMQYFMVLIFMIIYQTTNQNKITDINENTQFQLNGPVLFYHSIIWLFDSAIAFGIASLFFRRKKNVENQTKSTTHDHSELTDDEDEVNDEENPETDSQIEIGEEYSNLEIRNKNTITEENKDNEEHKRLDDNIANQIEENELNNQIEIDNDEEKQRKMFSRFSLEVQLNQNQKTIYSIASFLITLILTYVLAASFYNDGVELKKTWFFWVIFILFQVWIQNIIWNATSKAIITLYYPNKNSVIDRVKRMFENKKNTTKQTQSEINTDKSTNTVTSNKEIVNTKKANYIIMGLIATLALLIIISIFINYNKKVSGINDTALIDTDIPNAPDKTLENTNPRKLMIKSSLVFDNKTVEKLLTELDANRLKTYIYNDPLSLGFKFKSSYPESMNVFLAKSTECKAGAELIDENGNTLKYTIVLNQAAIPQLSSSQLEDILDETPKRQLEGAFKLMCKSYQVGTIEKTNLGNNRVIFFDVFMDNEDDNEVKYTACRSYYFYYKGGIGCLGFFLHNNNKQLLKKDFDEYKVVFSNIAERTELIL